MSDRLAASNAWCRALTRRTAGNFGYAFWTLPAEQRQAMNVLYAFMRLTDDLGDDETRSVEQRARQLADWRRDLDAALADQWPEHPVWPAIVHLVRKYQIPRDWLFAVISGVEHDLSPHRMATFAELEQYCYHVAGAVGLCCIRIWGYTGAAAEGFAIDCGLAFQLTNILRDLAEDADRGRLYLPQDDLARFGCTEDDLRQRRLSPEFLRLMAFETERARFYYRRAEQLHDCLAPVGRPVYRAMREIYGGLLTEIERRNFDVYRRRIRLPAWKKTWIVFRTLLSRSAR